MVTWNLRGSGRNDTKRTYAADGLRLVSETGCVKHIDTSKFLLPSV